MHNNKFFIFSVFSLIVLCANLSPLFAKAPTTPKILFTSTRDGNREIYVMNPDGSKQVNLTQHHAEDLQAVWSSTGEQILFVSDRDGIRDLYLMDPDGSNVRRVFKKVVYRYHPTWAPDGKQIAHMHKVHDLRASIIYTATLGKQKEESLVNALYPAWSPDGKEIACSVGGAWSRGTTCSYQHPDRRAGTSSTLDRKGWTILSVLVCCGGQTCLFLE